MSPRLAWVPELVASLSRATMGQVGSYRIEDTADPLKKLIHLQTNGELASKNYHPLCHLVHGFGKANDCVVERIRRGPKVLIVEVLTKRRSGPQKKHNPLLTGKTT